MKVRLTLTVDEDVWKAVRARAIRTEDRIGDDYATT